MNEYVAALLVLAVLVGILLLMVPGMRRAGYAPKTAVGLAGVLGPDDALGFPSGIVATLALIQGLQLASRPPTAAFVVAGIVCAGLAVGPRLLARIAFSFIGAVGIFASVVQLVGDGGCTGVPLVWTLLGIAALAASAILGALGMLRKARRPRVGLLELFAVVEILSFLASPLGVSLLNLGTWQGWVVIAAAVVFGFLASVAPRMVVGLAAVAVGVASLGMGALVGNACGPSAGGGGLLGLLVFIVAYVVVDRLIGSRRRARR